MSKKKIARAEKARIYKAFMAFQKQPECSRLLRLLRLLRAHTAPPYSGLYAKI
jgi:hypothetical protein